MSGVGGGVKDVPWDIFGKKKVGLQLGEEFIPGEKRKLGKRKNSEQ